MTCPTRSLTAVICAVLLCGCPLPSASNAPGAGGSSSTPGPAITRPVLLEQLAQAAERGEFQTNNEFLKVCNRTLKAAGIDPPAGYEKVMAPYAASNDKLDGEKAAAVLRSLK